MGARPTISLCMIVRDEEATLARALRSVAGVVDELIVVDTGSRDRSRELATAAGASVFDLAWNDDFASARNESLARATSEWILVLDADEELAAESALALPSVVATTAHGGLLLHVVNQQAATDLSRAERFALTRLFRRHPSIAYQSPIHEQVRPSIERAGFSVGASELQIVHHGYQSTTAQGGVQRAERNHRILTRALDKAPSDSYLRYQLGITEKAMGRDREAYATLRSIPRNDVHALGDATANYYMKLAQLALSHGDSTGADEYARASLAIDPDNMPSLHVLAMSQLDRGELRDAMQSFLAVRAHRDLNPLHARDLEQIIAACDRALNPQR